MSNFVLLCYMPVDKMYLFQLVIAKMPNRHGILSCELGHFGDLILRAGCGIISYKCDKPEGGDDKGKIKSEQN